MHTNQLEISALQLNAIKKAISYNLTVVSNIREITNPLKQLGINEFCYTKFQKNTRVVALHTATSFLEHYSLNIHRFSRSDFIENFLFKLSDKPVSWYIYPNTLDLNFKANEVFQLETNFKVAQGMCLAFQDIKNQQIEIFDFHADFSNINVYSALLFNIDFLEKFSYFFKEQATKIIQEGEKSGKKYIKKSLDLDKLPSQNNSSKQLFSCVNHYYLQRLKEKAYLTASEFKCLKLYMQGLNNKVISKQLNISTCTVAKHLDNIRHKSQYSNLQNLYFLNSRAIW